jgi:hypothetical protein
VCLLFRVDRDSAVVIATHYGLEASGVESRWGLNFPHPSRPVLGPTQPSLQWGPGLFPGSKAAGAWISDHPSPSSVEVKERVQLYLYSPLWIFMVFYAWILPFTCCFVINKPILHFQCAMFQSRLSSYHTWTARGDVPQPAHLNGEASHSQHTWTAREGVPQPAHLNGEASHSQHTWTAREGVPQPAHLNGEGRRPTASTPERRGEASHSRRSVSVNKEIQGTRNRAVKSATYAEVCVFS